MKKNKKICIGKRIYDDYLGYGEIVGIIDKYFCMVLFDVTPPFRYNLAENPTLIISDSLKFLRVIKK